MKMSEMRKEKLPDIRLSLEALVEAGRLDQADVKEVLESLQKADGVSKLHEVRERLMGLVQKVDEPFENLINDIDAIIGAEPDRSPTEFFSSNPDSSGRGSGPTHGA